MKTQGSIPKFALATVLFCLWSDAASAYYDPGIQRWINRDPINEQGFERFSYPRAARISYYGHDYAFVKNAPVALSDPLGLFEFGRKCKPQDKEAIRTGFADLCRKAKKGDCFRCLDQEHKQAMNDACDGKKNIKVECEDTGSNSRCVAKARGQTCGWSDGGVIHLCMNCDTGCFALHEVAHAVGGVGPDSAMTPKPDPNAYAIAKCAGGCSVPDFITLPRGY